ncbi:membrane progestin receptor gamma-B isoform X3 [Xenopus laevis]|nr:membrane progestin receptor gamma-B isoform X3 [Xenopus laevis]XP_041444116.1 membrane progestin receptor gamma-B isoform X3 [Xenopus laevis]XP_041444117.1 membrane progestin receptor gamma-B isoform X3 [Xenopus laevis]XP_041444118.1 membrane progestin receptor gamma-B isoform X3 [Xenopus laevis]XP_041444119.1 membrane progestin receptor gamma-B isoform X3 [Xenopus laevis]XP_041444120.1 membrane progestin receptor gamma-B isoform X3 [Xenopus laevis]XP_041444121.1 membrane progestin recepto
MLSWKLPRLLTIQQIPKVFHEDSILCGYRSPCSSAKTCILSLFQMTNETLNIWTHFIPTWYFLWRMLSFLYSGFWDDPFLWPLLVYQLSCCIYPLASTCAHTFSVMSTKARHICFFLDYGAVSLYSLGAAIAYSAYVFPDRWVGGTFHQWYVSCAVVNTIICTALACYSRLGAPVLHYNQLVIERIPEVSRPRLSKVLRTTAFAYPYFFDSIPLFYRLFLCSGSGCAQNAALPMHIWHSLLAFLTAFLFSTHLPERLAPGRFDYVGHSHQLFHVCGVMGTYIQMEVLIKDMNLRREWLVEKANIPSFSNTLGAWGIGMTLSFIVIVCFSLALYWKPRIQKKKKRRM